MFVSKFESILLCEGIWHCSILKSNILCVSFDFGLLQNGGLFTNKLGGLKKYTKRRHRSYTHDAKVTGQSLWLTKTAGLLGCVVPGSGLDNGIITQADHRTSQVIAWWMTAQQGLSKRRNYNTKKSMKADNVKGQSVKKYLNCR